MIPSFCTTLTGSDIQKLDNNLMSRERIPYQTLIASVLHKFVSGRLIEKSSRITNRSTRSAKKQGEDSINHME